MRRVLKGTVLSVAMQDTAVVEVATKRRHPLYHKSVAKRKSYAVDTKGVTVSVGDIVSIEETRPLAKSKHFRVRKDV